MRAFRLVKASRAAEAFNGEGARLYGGRWNLPGTPMVYAAESRALAALETLVHVPGTERRLRFVVYELAVPDDLVERLPLNALPPDWREPAPPRSTQEIGTAWQKSLRSPALLVPSVLVINEHCVLLNPSHPDIKRIFVKVPEVFEFDGRL